MCQEFCPQGGVYTPRQTPPDKHHPGQTHPSPQADTPSPAPRHHCSARYASYWNVFLFCNEFLSPMTKSEIQMLTDCIKPIFRIRTKLSEICHDFLNSPITILLKFTERGQGPHPHPHPGQGILPVSILTLAAQYSLSVRGALVEGVTHSTLAAVALGTHIHADLPVVHLAPEVRLGPDVNSTGGAVWALLTRGILKNHIDIKPCSCITKFSPMQ